MTFKEILDIRDSAALHYLISSENKIDERVEKLCYEIIEEKKELFLSELAKFSQIEIDKLVEFINELFDCDMEIRVQDERLFKSLHLLK